MLDLSMISDLLLAAGAIAAAAYCVVLAGRLKRFNNLESGMGGAVAVLSAQVDDMTKTLQKAQRAAVTSSVHLTELTERAEAVSQRMELMLASMHDLPEESGRETFKPADSGAGSAANPSVAATDDAVKVATTVPAADSRLDMQQTMENSGGSEPVQGPTVQTAAERHAPETDQPVFLSRRQVMEAAE